MVSNRPDPIPPAFRGASQPSFIGMTDEQVLKIAEHYFHLAPAFPLASRQRAAAWEMFDDAMAELSARGLRQILRKMREHEELGDEIPEALRRAARLDLATGEIREDGLQPAPGKPLLVVGERLGGFLARFHERFDGDGDPGQLGHQDAAAAEQGRQPENQLDYGSGVHGCLLDGDEVDERRLLHDEPGGGERPGLEVQGAAGRDREQAVYHY